MTPCESAASVSPVQSSPVQSADAVGKASEAGHFGAWGSAFGGVVFLALLYFFLGHGQQWLERPLTVIDAKAAPNPAAISASAPADITKSTTGSLPYAPQSPNLHGCKYWNVTPWQVTKGKAPLPIPPCDESAVTELLLNKYGRVESASVRDPGVVPTLALQLAAQAEQQRSKLIDQLLADAKPKDKEAKTRETLVITVYLTVAAGLLTGFLYASLSAIKLMFGTHGVNNLAGSNGEKKDDKKPGGTAATAIELWWLLVPLIPMLTLGGALGVGAYQAYAPASVLDPQVLSAVSHLAASPVDAELMQLARQSMTLNQAPGGADSGQAALNATLVASLNQQRSDLEALNAAVKSVDGSLVRSADRAASAADAPMATPNCSTVGQSNCSRQDGVIMRGLR